MRNETFIKANRGRHGKLGKRHTCAWCKSPIALRTPMVRIVGVSDEFWHGVMHLECYAAELAWWGKEGYWADSWPGRMVRGTTKESFGLEFIRGSVWIDYPGNCRQYLGIREVHKWGDLEGTYHIT